MRKSPIDRVLTETDGPFLARGDEPVEPGEVGCAREMVTSPLGSSVEDARSQILSNLKRLVQSD